MKKHILAIVFSIALSIPAVSLADPYYVGPYFSGFLGATMAVDADVTGFRLDDRVEFDPGINVGGTFGFDYGFMRLEAELSYKQAEIVRVVDRLQGVSYRDIDGRIEATALMGNMFLDLHSRGPITPYFGGGVGFAGLYQSDVDGTSNFDGSRVELYQSDDDTVFAYQVGAGLEIALNRMLSLDLSYRYFGTSRATFNEDTDEDNELEFESHNVAAGLRVKF